MAIYKVIQDVEAEDTLIGPLTLKQCIYAAIAFSSAYACFFAISKNASFLVVLFLPFVFIGGFLAFPWSRQQPTEIWLLAKIRFMLKPRRRIWDQSGARELVTITAPRQVQALRTKNLSQTEVKSRLKALADTIDTRGWAIKNVGVNIYGQQGGLPYESSDRLVNPNNFPPEVPSYDTSAVVDMLDPQTNPLAKQLDEMMQTSASSHRQQIVSRLQQSQQPAPAAQTPAPADGSGQASYWYLNHPLPAGQGAPVQNGTATAPPAAAPVQPTADEAALLEKLKHRSKESASYLSHLRTIKPLSEQEPETALPAQAASQPPQIPVPLVTPAVKPATIELANNNDLSVAAISREAKRINSEPPDEVIVSLH